MDESSDKRSNMVRKTGGASANLGESLPQEGVPRDEDREVEDVSREKPTVEGLLVEVKALQEDTRKFQDKTNSKFQELSGETGALKVTMKELLDLVKRIEGAEVLDKAAVRSTKGEQADLLRENEEPKITVEELKKSIGPVEDVPEEIETQEVKSSSTSSSPFRVFPEKEINMEEDSDDKRSSLAGVSANPGKSLKQRWLTHLKRDRGVDDHERSEQDIEVFQEGNKTPKAAFELVEVEGRREEAKKYHDEEEISAPSTPFGGLPEEIWEQILGELEDSKDVLNLFKVFPHLEGRVLKNKYSWLFDQVVPYLRPWIKKQDMLSCRLVCRKWAHGVDNYLENLHKVAEPERAITGQACYPEGSWAHKYETLRYQDEDKRDFPFERVMLLTQFLRAVDKHPSARNPVLGRSVGFHIVDPDDDRLCYSGDSWQYQNAAMNILRKCGRHVWFLSLKYLGDNFYQLFRQILSLVPNLKGLEVTWSLSHLDEDSEDLTMDDPGTLFPLLPQLESLNTRMRFACPDPFEQNYMPRNLLNLSVPCYATQIKRLCIAGYEFKKISCRNFPVLRELHLLSGTFVGHSPPDDLLELLTSLAAPNLSKLCVYVELDHRPDCATLTSIVPWMKPFPNLQHFGLKTDGDLMSDHVVGVGLPVIECVPSITSISISCRQMHVLGSELSRCFPSLEYAHIKGDVRKNVYCWHLWEELQSLKEINVRERYRSQKHYNRANYEWFKKHKSLDTKYPQFVLEQDEEEQNDELAEW